MLEQPKYKAVVKTTFWQKFIGWNLSLYVNKKKTINLFIYSLIITFILLPPKSLRVNIPYSENVDINLYIPKIIFISVVFSIIILELTFFLRTILYRKQLESELNIIVMEDCIKSKLGQSEVSLKYEMVKDIRILGDYLFLIPRKKIKYGWIPLSSFGEKKDEFCSFLKSKLNRNE